MIGRERLAAAAIAKVNSNTVNIEGIYEADRQKFQALSQDLGITFDSNNNITSNQIKTDVNTLDSSVDILNNKIAAIASVLGITFNADGTLATEEYTTHTHSYVDTTIADTADGTGTESETTKSTSEVN